MYVDSESSFENWMRCIFSHERTRKAMPNTTINIATSFFSFSLHAIICADEIAVYISIGRDLTSDYY